MQNGRTTSHNQKSSKASPRQFRQLDFIKQFITDIKHIFGSNEAVADAASRLEVIAVLAVISYEELSATQMKDKELQTLLLHPERTFREAKFHYGVTFPSKQFGNIHIPPAMRKSTTDGVHTLLHSSGMSTIS